MPATAWVLVPARPRKSKVPSLLGQTVCDMELNTENGPLMQAYLANQIIVDRVMICMACPFSLQLHVLKLLTVGTSFVDFGKRLKVSSPIGRWAMEDRLINRKRSFGPLFSLTITKDLLKVWSFHWGLRLQASLQPSQLINYLAVTFGRIPS
jgi:hypothetical protein